MTNPSPDPLLAVSDVSKSFGRAGLLKRAPVVRAVSDVSMMIERGESVGIVGESGSGKSTLAKMICGLSRPDSGSIRLNGQDVYAGRHVNRDVWRTVQIVFQDPYTSLNPAMRIGELVAEPIRLWHGVEKSVAMERARALLVRVGLDESVATSRVTRLSGGQRQRVSIARALAVEPLLMLFDESVSALDVSVQAQILELLHNLRRETDLTYLLISHDIAVIRVFCERILVMNNGEIVEECRSADLTPETVTHPYTRQLLQSVPTPRH